MDMKNWKKCLSLALALMMVLSLMAGCSGGKKEPVETEPEVTLPVVYDSYFKFYDYGTGAYVDSNVGTYQAVTGAVCELSSLDFAFLEDDYEYVVEGYHEEYGVFLYSYNKYQVDQYRNYLTTVGYLCTGTEQFEEGFSYYFSNSANGYTLDIFVAADETYVAIEPYLNRNPEGAAQETQATDDTDLPVSADACYYFYDYANNEYLSSDVSVYQNITGARALKSMLDWGFLEEGYEMIVDGYNAEYALFMYEYSAVQMARYEDYLVSIGYAYEGSEQFDQGTSYYYKHPGNGSLMDLFVANNDAYLVIEPCLNRDVETTTSDFPTPSTFYYFYDYKSNEYYYSEVGAYQDITGARALQSMLDWGFLEAGYEMIVDGYNVEYALFMYEYSATQLAVYEDYLTSIGYEYTGSERFAQGVSYYYKHPGDGSLMDLFVANNEEYLVIEPCLNRD